MTVTVTETAGRQRARIRGKVCCEAGHPDARDAARHAQRLTRALERHEGGKKSTR